jgi:hypothetical protein
VDDIPQSAERDRTASFAEIVWTYDTPYASFPRHVDHARAFSIKRRKVLSKE